MLKRIRHNWNKLSIGEKRRIIILGIEQIILFVGLWTAFVIFLYFMGWYTDRTVTALENIERVLMG